MKTIRFYFPNLTEEQYDRLGMLQSLYAEWNARINVISRKDIESLNERHVLHSLSIAKFIQFRAGTSILDIGTGGGFPGIPLAILFPESQFTLVDSIGKKIKVVEAISKALQLQNVTGIHTRAEQVNQKFDFVVSRAVTRMNSFLPWTKNLFNKENKNDIPNGIIYLKGGDLREELSEIKLKYQIHNIAEDFKEEFFETKKIVYLPAT